MAGGQVYRPTLTALTSHFVFGQGTEQESERSSKAVLKGGMRFVRKDLAVGWDMVAMLWGDKLLFAQKSLVLNRGRSKEAAQNSKV